jgi:serine/threonine-protein phosphatase 2A regulatory subunit A
MSAPLMKWVEDPVFAVRDATLDAIFNIGNRFGSEWTKGQIFHLIEMLVSSPVFTKRMTALKAINKLHSLLDYSDCVNFLTTLSTDKIPNIRFNVAKTMQNLAKEFRIDSELVGIVEKMKNDCDIDVRFYAGQALLSICGNR